MVLIPVYLIYYGLLLTGPWQTVPYKPNDQFSLEIKLDLRPKPYDRYTVDFSETVEERNRKTSSQLPYLVVHLRFPSFSPEEKRVRGFNNNLVPMFSKKAEDGLLVKLELGYTDDIKDRTAPHEFNVYTFSSEKKEIYVINLLVTEDGTFLVNGEVRGKF